MTERMQTISALEMKITNPGLNLIARDVLTKVLKPNSRIDELATQAIKMLL